MKKILAILLIILTLSFSLMACGSNGLIGTWEISDQGVTLTLVLEKDGKGSISALNSDKFEVEWTAKKGKITATASIGDENNSFFNSAEYTIKDDKLTVTTEEDTFILTRKK